MRWSEPSHLCCIRGELESFLQVAGWLSSCSLDHNPDCFEIDLHVLAATITNCGFRIVIVGMLFLIFGHLGSGWPSITYFAWGMVISVGVFC